MLIQAVDNPLIKELVSLHEATGRRAGGAFLVEGRRAIAGLLAAGWTPLRLCIREGEEQPPGWPTAITLGERAAKRASAAATPSGYLASFALPDPGPLDPAAGGLILAGVADPGNLGTLLRTAAAFAVGQVACLGGADPFGSKAVQASAGAIAAVRLFRPQSWSDFSGGACLTALVPRGGAAPPMPAGPRWLVVGGEADGIPAEGLALCSERLSLPMPGSAVESLNAAVAGAIALWEVFGRAGARPA